jgi:hypothetical protein
LPRLDSITAVIAPVNEQLAPRRREAKVLSGGRTRDESGGEPGPGHTGEVEGVQIVEIAWRRGFERRQGIGCQEEIKISLVVGES